MAVDEDLRPLDVWMVWSRTARSERHQVPWGRGRPPGSQVSTGRRDDDDPATDRDGAAAGGAPVPVIAGRRYVRVRRRAGGHRGSSAVRSLSAPCTHARTHACMVHWPPPLGKDGKLGAVHVVALITIKRQLISTPSKQDRPACFRRRRAYL